MAITRQIQLGSFYPKRMSEEQALALGHYLTSNKAKKYFNKGEDCIVSIVNAETGELIEYSFRITRDILWRASKSTGEDRFEVLSSQSLGVGSEGSVFVIDGTLEPQPEDGSVEFKTNPEHARVVKVDKRGNPNPAQHQVSIARAAGDDLHYKDPVLVPKGEWEQDSYVVMRRAKNKLLLDYLDEIKQHNGQPDFDKSLQIAINLFHALSALHARGLIHRDIKPANIVIDTNTLAVTLIDYGLSFKAENINYLRFMGGTPAYMSYEAFKANPIPAADEYAMGKVVAHLFKKLPQPVTKHDLERDNCFKIASSDVKIRAIQRLPTIDLDEIPDHEAINNLIEGLLRCNYKVRLGTKAVLEKLHELKANRGARRKIPSVISPERALYLAAYQRGRAAAKLYLAQPDTKKLAVSFNEIPECAHEVEAYISGLGFNSLTGIKTRNELISRINDIYAGHKAALAKPELIKNIKTVESILENLSSQPEASQPQFRALILKLKKYLRVATRYSTKEHRKPIGLDELVEQTAYINRRIQTFTTILEPMQIKYNSLQRVVSMVDEMIAKNEEALLLEFVQKDIAYLEKSFASGLYGLDVKLCAANIAHLVALIPAKEGAKRKAILTTIMDHTETLHIQIFASLPQKLQQMRDELKQLQNNLNTPNNIIAQIDHFEKKYREIADKQYVPGLYYVVNGQFGNLCASYEKSLASLIEVNKNKLDVNIKNLVLELNELAKVPAVLDYKTSDNDLYKRKLIASILTYIHSTSTGWNRLFSGRSCSARRCKDIGALVKILRENNDKSVIFNAIKKCITTFERGTFGRSLLADNLLAVMQSDGYDRTLSEQFGFTRMLGGRQALPGFMLT